MTVGDIFGFAPKFVTITAARNYREDGAVMWRPEGGAFAYRIPVQAIFPVEAEMRVLEALKTGDPIRFDSFEYGEVPDLFKPEEIVKLDVMERYRLEQHIGRRKVLKVSM